MSITQTLYVPMVQAQLGLDLAELKKKNTSHGKDFSKITCSDAWVIGLFSFGNG